MEKLAIEGIDGSGKSTVAEATVAAYAKQGVLAKSVSVFRNANEKLGIDVFELWDTNSYPDAVNAVISAEEEAIQQAKEENVEVLLFDRHWLSGRVFTESTRARDEWKSRGLQPIPTALIRVSPVNALARKQAANDEDLDQPWMTLQELTKDAASFELELTKHPDYRYAIYRSDDVIANIIACNITWDRYTWTR